MHREELSLQAADGTPIAAVLHLPSLPARGLVQIVHGMAEHAARYDHFARSLNEAGYAVVAHDQRGHGAATGDEAIGHFADQDGWRRVLEDVRAVREHARARVPDGPLCVFGHSMGSFIALADATDEPHGIDRLVLSGSNRVGPDPLVHAGLAAAKLERRRIGPRGKSALLTYLSFGSFNKAFAPARTEFDWLSRDPAEVDAYIADPRCGFRVSTQFWIDMLEGILALDGARLRRLPRSLPIYVLGGARDPVSKGGAGLRRLVEQLRNAGVADVELRIYADGRHEMLNEINRDQVIGELIAWLRRKEHANAA